MSWVWKADQRLRTPEQVMAELIQVVNELSMPDKRGAAICAGMCVAQESDFYCPWNAADPESKNYRYDSQSDDGRSVGYFQQQKGPQGQLWWGTTQSEMDLHSSASEFLSRLKKVGYNAGNAQAANDSVQSVQRSGVPQGYVKHWDRINDLYDRVTANPRQPGEQPVPAAPQPPFKELDFMTGGGRSNRSRPPINWLIHTEEGNSSAENLARYCNGSHDVSYHYTLRDGIVCDVVDTDYASWSVLDANAYTINLCFAGSRAAMTRDEWLARDGDLRIAAWLAVQDCRKYKIPLDIIAPPYGNPRPGISDHKYVTQALHIGTHTDVGDNFPWDVFGRYVSEYAGTAPPVVSPPPFVPDVLDRAGGTLDDQLLYRWNCLGGLTAVEALAQIRDKVCGTQDAGKPGVKTL